MSDVLDTTDRKAEFPEIARIAKLLGGVSVLRSSPQSPLDAHELLLKGLPSRVLQHLVSRVAVISSAETIELALGISVRTYQRHKDSANKALSQEQSGRAWKFAEILSRATDVLGSQEEAEQWLQRPALALEQRRPLDLLATPAGVELVEDLLTRLEYGVYT